MKKIELNIKNLTSLWEFAGKTVDGYHRSENTFLSQIEHSEWPNRIWTDKPLNQKNTDIIKQKMRKYNSLTFSHFNKNENESLLKKDTYFRLKSVQYGMSLPLKNKFETKKNIDFKKVNDQKSAEIWCKSFYESFKYNISTETVLKTQNNVLYFLAYHKNELLGTAILFVTQNVAGIHSLGIIPGKRKQGFASEVMYHILNMAISQKLDLATLQASEMAKEMYLKMGFSPDFLMENYKLKQ